MKPRHKNIIETLKASLYRSYQHGDSDDLRLGLMQFASTILRADGANPYEIVTEV